MIAYYSLVAVLGIGVAVMAAVAVWSTVVIRRDRRAEYGVPAHCPRHGLKR